MLNPAEVAQLANVSRKKVYREIDRGELKALHVDRDPLGLLRREWSTEGSLDDQHSPGQKD
jgi:hypothetical protein